MVTRRKIAYWVCTAVVHAAVALLMFVALLASYLL
jgi:hypothetical protein